MKYFRIQDKESLRKIRRNKSIHSKKGKKRQGVVNVKPTITSKGKIAK